jgi:hypothetical protein
MTTSKTTSDISLLLDRWYEIKENIALFETKLEKCKIVAENYMDEHNIDTISTNNITLTRRDLTRLSVSKKDLPEDIWDRYAKETSYKAFYINKKGEPKKTKKKSPKKLSSTKN